MDDLAPFTYLLIFAVLALLNYAMQRIAEWLRRRKAPEAAGKAAPSPETPPPVEVLKQPSARRVDARVPEEPPSRLRQRADRVRRARESVEEPLEVREARAQRSRAEAVSSPPKHVVPRVRPLMRDRQSLRQAIVIMTVLGPCRAQQPPDMR